MDAYTERCVTDWLCEDCYVLLVNGDAPSDWEPRDPETGRFVAFPFLSAYRPNGTFLVTAGMMREEHECHTGECIIHCDCGMDHECDCDGEDECPWRKASK